MYQQNDVCLLLVFWSSPNMLGRMSAIRILDGPLESSTMKPNSHAQIYSSYCCLTSQLMSNHELFCFRDNYDKKVKATKTHEKRPLLVSSNKPKKPEQRHYVPPSHRDSSSQPHGEATDSCQQQGEAPLLPSIVSVIFLCCDSLLFSPFRCNSTLLILSHNLNFYSSPHSYSVLCREF